MARRDCSSPPWEVAPPGKSRGRKLGQPADERVPGSLTEGLFCDRTPLPLPLWQSPRKRPSLGKRSHSKGTRPDSQTGVGLGGTRNYILPLGWEVFWGEESAGDGRHSKRGETPLRELWGFCCQGSGVSPSEAGMEALLPSGEMSRRRHPASCRWGVTRLRAGGAKDLTH